MIHIGRGCPAGEIFNLLRFSGDAESFGARDWLALVAIACAAGCVWQC